MIISMRENKEINILFFKRLKKLKIILTKKTLKPLMKKKILQPLMKMKRKILLKLQQQRYIIQFQIRLNNIHKSLREKLRS